MINMNEEKSRAAYLLSDEIYGAFRSAQLADHLLNSIMDFRMDDEEVDATDQYTLRATFKEIIWRVDILSRYLSEARSDLHLLDTAARDYKPESVASNAVVAAPKTQPQTSDEILARVKELTSELDAAAQQRMIEMFGEKTQRCGRNAGEDIQ